MERIIAAVLAGSVVVSLGGAAFADQHTGGMDGRGMGPHGMGAMFDFAAIDADADGRITPAEIAAHRAARFAAADTNGDGALDRAELEARAIRMMAERMAARALDRMDADRNGTLSPEELAAGPGLDSRAFIRMDADKDGALTQAEIDAARAAMQERHAKRGEGRGHGGGHEGRGDGSRAERKAD